MNNLAKNLTELRKKNNLTQDDVAQKVFLSRQAVSKWERGESDPDTDSLIVLSRIYGISIDEMICSNDINACAAKLSEAEGANELKKRHKKQLIKRMAIWALCLFGFYALICGIIQTSLFMAADKIWLIWFSLPVVPLLAFAAHFRYEIGLHRLMFFLNMPFISAIIFMLMLSTENPNGAWIAFLLIPAWYILALIVYFTVKSKATKSCKTK